MLELFGMLLALLGIVDDLGILDTTLSIIIWPWLLLKGSSTKPNRKTGFNMGKAVRRQVACSFVELIPLLGTILLLWSYSVYIVLKEEIISEEEYQKENKMLSNQLGQRIGGLRKAGKSLVRR